MGSGFERAARLALLIGGVGLALACGGGEGDSATGTTASSEGPITGFGSVIQNGERWDTDEAAFEIDGRQGTQADLDVGMVVRIEGRKRGDGTARADRVVFESRLRGPVRAIERLGPDTLALEIFGIRALVSRADTKFRDTDLDAITLGRMVELSGLVTPGLGLEVTHLRDRGRPVVGVSEVKLFGRVEGLAGGSFVLGTSEVRFDRDTRIDDFGPDGLRDGLLVRVAGLLLANDGVDASAIQSLRRDRDDIDEVEIHGIVSDFVSLADFRVAGRRVDASGARLVPDDPDLLRDGVRVEVEGRFRRDRVLVADKLTFKSVRVRIHAAIGDDADVDPEANVIHLLGIPIDVDRLARRRDDRRDRDDLPLELLGAGDFLEVRGLARADGRVTATRLERREVDDVRLRGPVDMIEAEARRFTILGVLIETSSRTEFEGPEGLPIRPEAFFERIRPGIVVDAKDREDGDATDFDHADEVEIETPGDRERDD